MMKGITLWFTGLPCSGKSTVADEVAKILKEKGFKVERLDGDILRKHISKGLGFSKEDRFENLRRAGFIAKLLTRNGVIVLASFVSPYREIRNELRKEIGSFAEVFVKASVDTCIKRDVKGMWKKAISGEIKNFTGWDDPYEEPENPELVLNTDVESVEESVNKVLEFLRERGII